MTPRAQKMASPDFIWPLVVRLHRHSDVLCALFVVAGFAAWWVWSEAGKPRKAEVKPVVAQMTWLPSSPVESAGAWQSDVRAISSPVLFALPTPLGFSRGALAVPGLTPAPAPVTTNVLIESLPAPTSLVAQIERMTPGESAVAARSAVWPRDIEALAPAARTDRAVVVSWQAGSTAAQRRVVSAGTNGVWADIQSWEIVARLELDRHGWAESVLLEKSSLITNRNAAVVQMLRTMNFAAAGPGPARVVVRYEGGAP